MADDGNPVKRRRTERNEYRQALLRIANLFDNELGNESAPRSRPDDREWRVQRVKTIQTLNELKRKLDTVCVGANYGKTVGNGAEIAGAVGAVIGAVMSLFGFTSSSKVTNIAKMVQHTGTCIGGVSDIIESHISEKYLREIQAVLEEDQALSRPLAEWLNFSNELEADVEAIFGVNLASGIFNTVIKVFLEASKFTNSVRDFNSIISLMEQERYSVYIGNEVKVEKLEIFYQYLSTSPQFADKVRHILSVLSESTGNVQVFIDGVRAYHSIMSISSSSVIPTLQGGDNPEIPTTAEVSVFCVFQAISLASSVLSMINTANIIKHGTSQYSDALECLIRSLSWELERMENLTL